MSDRDKIQCCFNPHPWVPNNSEPQKYICLNCHAPLAFVSIKHMELLSRAAEHVAKALAGNLALRTEIERLARTLKRVLPMVMAVCVLTLAGCGEGYTGLTPPDAGSPCSCDHTGAYYYATDNLTHETTVIETCVSHEPVNTCGLTRGDAGCDGYSVCFGAYCCTWEPGAP